MYSHLHRTNQYIYRIEDPLHVIAVCFNPMRYLSRYGLFREFVQRAVQQGAMVHVVEAAFGERKPECMDHGQATTWVFRTSEELWNKEAMINAAVAKLPHDWKYVFISDADVAFTNPHWVDEVKHQLQHYPVVQGWHTAIDLSPENLPLTTFKSFVATHLENPEAPDPRDGYYYVGGRRAGKPGLWHPGYAWGYRRDAWNTIGGLLDFNIVGGGDHQMALAYYAKATKGIPFKSTASYRSAVLGWQSHAARLKQNVGFVPGTLLHYWHGKKIRRGYFDRWKILERNKFDPVKDLRRDWQGLWQLSGDKPQLRDDLRMYFRARQEDTIEE